MKRTYCEICTNTSLEVFYTIPKLPIRIGISDKPTHYKFRDLEYAYCKNCHNVQIYNLPKLTDVYAINHNINVVGKTWTEHNKKLSLFISSLLPENASILEIGDPSAKMAILLTKDKRINEWSIVEPNAESVNIPKVIFIGAFFDKHFRTKRPYDVLIMSHLFEHLIGLKELFPVMHNALVENGHIVMSVPNLQHILNEGSMAPAGIHFEHTFYFNNDILKNLFHNYGFELTAHKAYATHSEFLCFRKIPIPRNKTPIINADDAKKKILQAFASAEKKRKNFISISSENIYDAIFIYGAHIQTQMYVSMDLKTKKLTGVLDNDTSKQYKFVYGTNLQVFPTQDVAKYRHPLIFCDMGPYTQEIIQQILILNPNAQIV